MVDAVTCAVKDLTEIQVQTLCSQATSQAPAIIVLIASLLFFTIFGLMFVKKNRGKLALILVLTAIFSVAILVWLLLSPHLVYQITQFFIGGK
jgi:hypothetical protein